MGITNLPQRSPVPGQALLHFSFGHSKEAQRRGKRGERSPQCLLDLSWQEMEVWTGSPPSISCQCFFRPFCATLLHSSLAGSWPYHIHAAQLGDSLPYWHPASRNLPPSPAKSKEHKVFETFPCALVLILFLLFYNPALLMERKRCRYVYIQVVLESSAIPMPQYISVSCRDRSLFVPSPAQVP